MSDMSWLIVYYEHLYIYIKEKKRKIVYYEWRNSELLMIIYHQRQHIGLVFKLSVTISNIINDSLLIKQLRRLISDDQLLLKVISDDFFF